jgi:lysophospholipase L1-like esterase
MAYSKQNFANGMTLTSSHLENIENGILDNIESIKNLNIASGNVERSFEGKVISILGDSISTFEGWIPVADGHNLTHRKRYPQADLLMDVRLTWWHKLITNLGAKLGINDSWAGSRVFNNSATNSGDQGPDACMASITRITNLGSNGTPDIIFFYGGTNDVGHKTAIGTFDSTANHTTVDLTSKTWSSFADAYKTAIMRMQYYYPDTKIISLLPMWTTSYYTVGNMDQYGEVVKSICDYFGVPVIDLRACGINWQNKGYTLGDGIHPSAEGMDLMERYIRRQLFSFYEGDYTEHVVYSITNNLTSFTNDDRYIKGVSAGKKYTAQLSGTVNNLSVKMDGVDITDEVFNFSTNVITIPAVTGDVVIDESGASKIYYTITYNYIGSNGNAIQSPTTERVAENVTKNFSADTAPYISGYKADAVTPSGSHKITKDMTVTYTYKVSSTTWYVDHTQQVSSFTTSVNIAGRGWTHVPGSAAYNAYVGKPVNTLGFFTDKASQDVTIVVGPENGTMEDCRVLATVTAKSSGTAKELVVINFPEVTLADKECLMAFASANDDINFYYNGTSSVTDANGIKDGNFYGRVPQVFGSGTAWSSYSDNICLGFSIGYTVTE